MKNIYRIYGVFSLLIVLLLKDFKIFIIKIPILTPNQIEFINLFFYSLVLLLIYIIFFKKYSE